MDFLPIYNIQIPKILIDKFIIETNEQQLYLDEYISNDIYENAKKYHELKIKYHADGHYKGLMEYIIDIFQISNYLTFKLNNNKIFSDNIIKEINYKLQTFDKPFINVFEQNIYNDDIFQLSQIDALFIFSNFNLSDVINFRYYRENNISINIIKNDHYDCLAFTEYLINNNDYSYINHNSVPPIFYKKINDKLHNYKSNKKYKYISENIEIKNEYDMCINKLSTILLLYDLLEEGGAFIFNIDIISLELTVDILCILSSLFKYVNIYKSQTDNIKRIICLNFEINIKKEIIQNIFNDILKIKNKFITKIISKIPENIRNVIVYSNDIEEKNLIHNIKKAYEIIKLYEIMNNDEKKIYLNNLLTQQYIKVNSFYEYYQLPIPINILFDENQINIIENLLIKFPSRSQDKLIGLETYNDKFKYLERKLYIQKRKIDILDAKKYSEITDKIKLSSTLKQTVSNIIDKQVSQAFLKMIEILYETNLISKDIKSFHTCELPGQMIIAINFYCKKHNLKVDWIGQSLNPINEENIKKYGNEIFSDNYDLLKNNKDRWDFGNGLSYTQPSKDGFSYTQTSNDGLSYTQPSKDGLSYTQTSNDGTGDVLTNVKYYSEKYNNSMDLMTSDCGLPDSVFGVQEDKMLNINFSQFIIALNVLKQGGNYVYKIFLPCVNPTNIFMIYTLYLNFEELYLYKPYQNPSSSEIYVIAKNYNRINKIPNQNDIESNKYESLFLQEYYNSINRMIEKTIGSMNRTIYLFYNEEHIKKIDRNKFNRFWIDKYKIKI